MSGRIRVVGESLNELADNFLRSANALGESLNDLDALVESLAASWEGDAHDQFREYFARWRSSSRELHQSLHRLHRVVRTAHQNYAAAETANLRMWGVG